MLGGNDYFEHHAILYYQITKWGVRLYLYHGYTIDYVNVNKTKSKWGKIKAIPRLWVRIWLEFFFLFLFFS